MDNKPNKLSGTNNTFTHYILQEMFTAFIVCTDIMQTDKCRYFNFKDALTAQAVLGWREAALILGVQYEKTACLAAPGIFTSCHVHVGNPTCCH